MNEKKRKEVEERVRKLIIMNMATNKIDCTPVAVDWEEVFKGIHSEIERAEKEGYRKGAKELAERLIEYYESTAFSDIKIPLRSIDITREKLSEMEKEGK